MAVSNDDNISNNTVLICLTIIIVVVCGTVGFLGVWHNKDTVTVITAILGIATPAILSLLAYIKSRENTNHLEKIRVQQKKTAEVVNNTAETVKDTSANVAEIMDATNGASDSVLHKQSEQKK